MPPGNKLIWKNTDPRLDHGVRRKDGSPTLLGSGGRLLHALQRTKALVTEMENESPRYIEVRAGSDETLTTLPK